MSQINTVQLDKKFAQEHKLKILIVDDVKANLLVVSSLLKRMGYAATCANDGLEALEILGKENFDLIFMDIRMPGMDGIETTIKIRDNDAKCCNYSSPVQIIALTADLQHTTKHNCINAGMNDYLTKPIKINVLADSLIKHYIAITRTY